MEKLSDGSGITFTVARLIAPDGTSLPGVGVTPDIVVRMTAPATGSASADAQPQRAIKQAQGMLAK